MKKIFFSLFVFLFIASLCFAQQAQVPISKLMAAQAAQKPVETFTGKVVLVTIGDVSTGVKSELVVVADEGQELSFVVKSNAPIIDKDAKTVNLSDIKKDDRVIVTYTMNAMGTHKAQSIKLTD